MSEHDDERDLAARLEAAAAGVDAAGVTRAGVEARVRERARARRLRSVAGGAVAAGLLVALGIGVAATAGDDGAEQVAADGPGTPVPADPTTTIHCGSGVPTTSTIPGAPPGEEGATTTATWTTMPPDVEGTGGPTTQAAPEPLLPEAVDPYPAATVAPTTEPGPSPTLPRTPDPCGEVSTATTTEPPVTEPPTTAPPGSTTTAPPTTAPPPATTAPAWPPALTAGEHGGTTWGVYLAAVPQDHGIDAPPLVEAERRAAADGYDALVSDLACDQGAAEALGLDVDAPLYAAAIYFATEEEAVLFEHLYQPEVLGIAQVTTYCTD